jgi:hypothetical protein
VDGVSLEGVGNHPNAWFSASKKYFDAKEGKSSSSMQVDVVKEEVM